MKYSIRHTLRIASAHIIAIGGAVYYGVTWPALIFALGTYYFRHFAVAGFYHRYFSHRSFKTSRAFQFIMALWGATSGHKGPLSWATSHRNHHRYVEKNGDPHSPHVLGFWEAYMGWVLRTDALPTDMKVMKDFARYPEIIWINRNHFIGTLAFLFFVVGSGFVIEQYFDFLNTTKEQIIIWGFFVSTLMNAHAAMIVNTLCHLFGKRNFDIPDESRNIWWLLPIGMGENWHNNHHAHPRRAKSGLKTWEWDPIYWGLCGLKTLGLIWDLHGEAARGVRDQK